MANKIKEIQNINVNQLKSLFSEGKFATVVFTKKSDGSERTLNGKLLVKSALKGGEAPYTASDYGQLRVFDVNLKDNNGKRVGGYRSVTAQNVKSVTSKGVKYVVKHPDVVLNFVQSIRYNFKSKVLTLKLNGKVYNYHNVGVHVHRGLIDATNKGAYFNQHIKGQYSFS